MRGALEAHADKPDSHEVDRWRSERPLRRWRQSPLLAGGGRPRINDRGAEARCTQADERSTIKPCHHDVSFSVTYSLTARRRSGLCPRRLQHPIEQLDAASHHIEPIVLAGFKGSSQHVLTGVRVAVR